MTDTLTDPDLSARTDRSPSTTVLPPPPRRTSSPPPPPPPKAAPPPPPPPVTASAPPPPPPPTVATPPSPPRSTAPPPPAPGTPLPAAPATDRDPVAPGPTTPPPGTPAATSPSRPGAAAGFDVEIPVIGNAHVTTHTALLEPPPADTPGATSPTDTPGDGIVPNPSASGRERGGEFGSPRIFDDEAVPPGDIPPHDPGGDDGRHWPRQIALGLLIGLAVALTVIFIRRSVDPASTSPPAPQPAESRAEQPVDATGQPAAGDTPVTTAITGAVPQPPPENAAPAPSETPAAPAPAPAAPAPTETPADTAPPATSAAGAAITPTSDGTVRVAGIEYPIERTCLTQPFAPDGGDYVVFSYLFADGTGVPQIVEQWFMDGGATGASYSDGGFPVGVDYAPLGADQFSVSLRRPGGPVEVVVNPAEAGPAECGGTIATSDPTTPDFAYTRTVVDACFGAEAGPLQYVGYLSDGGKFTATPNAGSGSTLRYAEPFVEMYVDPDAALTGLPDGLEIRGTASSDGFAGAVTKDIVVTLRNDVIRTCTEHDTPL